MKSFLNKNFLFLCIIFIQLFVLVFSFSIFKQGYHSDELYEYGFANSYDTRLPEIDGNGNSLSRQWLDSNKLLSYISVDKDHRFSYSNVFNHAASEYYNPPLKLLIIHTICSFFPGVFSRWFSFSTNIISFIVLQIFLYLFVKKSTKSIPASLACICLFGFGAGCFNSMMFLRMYIMGMAFGVIFIYYSFLYYLEENKKNKIFLSIAVFISLFLGAYTLHLFLVYAFPIVLIICLSYLFFKKISKMFCYGFTCLGAVGLSFIAFPKTVSDTMQSTDTYSYAAVKYSDSMQFRIYTSLATLDNFGFHTSMYSNIWMKNIVAVILFVIILSIPLIVLFRKEKWFKTFLAKLKDRTVYVLKDIRVNSVFLIAFISSIIFVIFLASKRTSIYFMSTKYAARYLYIIYPLISIVATLLFYYILKFFFSNKKIINVIVISGALFIASVSQIYNNQPFLMLHSEKGISLNDIEEDANCYILLRSNWFIVSFADTLYKTNSYYFVNYNHYKDEYDCFDEIDKNKPLYIIADASVFITDEINEKLEENSNNIYNTVYSSLLINEEDVLNHYKSLKDVKKIECVGEDWLFERDIKIYRVYF